MMFISYSAITRERELKEAHTSADLDLSNRVHICPRGRGFQASMCNECKCGLD